MTKLVKNDESADNQCYDMEKKQVKFFILSLDVPSHPLFKEQQELSTLPQVSLMSLLKKYDGITLKEETVRAADGTETTLK